MHLPHALLLVVAYVCEVIGWALGITLKLNLFNVKVLTMHRWFDISAAESDLGYSTSRGGGARCTCGGTRTRASSARVVGAAATPLRERHRREYQRCTQPRDAWESAPLPPSPPR